jgi:hypothetical protein
MAQCQNCYSSLGCGCQKRTASDGKIVCVNCVTDYEAKVAKNQANQTK